MSTTCIVLLCTACVTLHFVSFSLLALSVCLSVTRSLSPYMKCILDMCWIMCSLTLGKSEDWLLQHNCGTSR